MLIEAVPKWFRNISIEGVCFKLMNLTGYQSPRERISKIRLNTKLSTREK